MPSNLAVKFSPIVSDEKKLEVSLSDDQATLKLSTWTEDLGWCGQKTLTFDAEMLDELHRVIAAARYKLNGKKDSDSESENAAHILKFPSFS